MIKIFLNRSLHILVNRSWSYKQQICSDSRFRWHSINLTKLSMTRSDNFPFDARLVNVNVLKSSFTFFVRSDLNEQSISHIASRFIWEFRCKNSWTMLVGTKNSIEMSVLKASKTFSSCGFEPIKIENALRLIAVQWSSLSFGKLMGRSFLARIDSVSPICRSISVGAIVCINSKKDSWSIGSPWSSNTRTTLGRNFFATFESSDRTSGWTRKFS